MGGSSEQSTKFEPPEWTAGRYPGAMDKADQLANQGYQSYGGMKVAPMTPYQYTAGQLTADRAIYGDPQLNAARGSLMNISTGNAQNPYAGALSDILSGGARNPFADNKYTDKMIADTTGNMTDAFSRGQATINDAMAARAGAYGGSDHLKKQTYDAGELAKQVGQMGTNTRQSQNNFAAQLWNQDVGNYMNAAQMGGNMWNQDIGNVLQAAGASPVFSQLDQSSYDAMNKYGQDMQNYVQSGLASEYSDWAEARDDPYKKLDWLLSSLGKGSGQYGTNWQTDGGGMSPAALFGLLGTGYALTR